MTRGSSPAREPGYVAGRGIRGLYERAHARARGFEGACPYEAALLGVYLSSLAPGGPDIDSLPQTAASEDALGHYFRLLDTDPEAASAVMGWSFRRAR